MRSTVITSDPVLERFRAAATELYGGRTVLYGSRASGDFRPDSDYDIAVFLKDFTSLGQESRGLDAIEVAILDETGELVRAMPFPAGSWRDPASPLMSEIRKDGLDL